MGETKVARGYYARRLKGKTDKDDGVLLDSSGKGVKAFGELCKSIKEFK